MLKQLAATTPVDTPDITLIDQYKAGSMEAGQQLFIKHHKLILKIIFDVTKGRYYDDDCLQSGAVGLCIAAQRFQPELGYVFITYAYYWIRKYVLLEVCNELLPSGGIVFGRELKEKLFKYIGLKVTGISDAEIAEKMKLPREEVDRLAYIASEASRPLSTTQDDSTEYEVYGLPTAESSESEAMQNIENEEYTAYVEGLIATIDNPVERAILNKMLGLNGEEQISKADTYKALNDLDPISHTAFNEFKRSAYRKLKALLRPEINS